MGFYHWKTQFAPTAFEKNYINQLPNSKLYIRLFDVDFDPKTGFAQPLAALLGNEKLNNLPQALTPVVFLTNRTFQNLNETQIDSLAGLVAQKIQFYTEGGLFSNFNEKKQPNSIISKPNFTHEIQFDCDWTGSTRDRFFYFLRKIKLQMPNKQLSSTIRLHQIKFPEKTGVPPVERGILMAYNMGDLDDLASKNSILDLNILKNYSEKLDKYPLRLDVALPIFSWAVVFRDGEAVRLMPNFPQKLPPQYGGVLKPLAAANRLEVLKNGYVEGVYLYKNDQIRLEKVSLTLLQATAHLLSQKMRQQPLTVSFFSLDSTNLTMFQPEDLARLVAIFEKKR